jgi:hypothetical protein
MQKKFIGIISYGVYLQPILVSSGGPWKFPWNIALQLGTGGPVERPVGLPTKVGGPVETPGGGGPVAFAIGIEVTVVDSIAIKPPTTTIMVSIVRLLLLLICIFIQILHLIH